MFTNGPENVLYIDKPAGCTSFDVIRQLRRQTGLRKFGHAGTLDPAATGLMLIGVGPGTKQLTALTKLDKVYEAMIFLGASSTTGDRDGEVVAVQPVDMSALENRAVEEVLAGLVGEVELPVSAYSAIKRDGVPMYKRARAAAARGETVDDVPVRLMYVYSAELLDMQSTTYQEHSGVALRVRFHVGSGTYIRSLAEAVGQRLGYPAMLTALRRTKVGEFCVEDAVTPESVQELEIK